MKKKFSKKQIAFVLVAICLVGLIGIGISYSYYLANISTSNEQNKNSDISSATITKVVMDMQGKVTSDGAYPGHKVVKEVVVRGIGENNSIPANASIQITPDLGDFSSDVTWKLYKSEDAITCSSTVHTDGGKFYEEATCNIPENSSLELEGGAGTRYKNIIVNPSTETKYYLVVEYANGENQNNQIGKSFSIDIELGEKIPQLQIIKSSIDMTGKCPSVNEDGTLNVTGVEATAGYVCAAPDTYGKSYYYRGVINDNYVKFAGFYWRIVRINGDDTVRIIYDGTQAHTNGDSIKDRHIGEMYFNSNSSDNAYLGYMYGNRDAVVEATKYYSTISFTNTNTYYIAKEYNYDATTDRFTLKNPIAVLGSDLTTDYVGYYTLSSTRSNDSMSFAYRIVGVTPGSTRATVAVNYLRYGTTTKKQAQTNTNDSTIKKYLDNWYKTNISGTENEQYLSDNIFCNDRSFSSSNSGTGAGVSTTYYNWHNWPASKSNLKCPQQNDAFTVSDTTNGNGALTYPIGLITTDEAVLAGGWSSSNSGYYLYSGSWYWASSPSLFDGNFALVRYVFSDGGADDYYYVDNFGLGVRPVFNLKAEILLQGSGTATDPYRLSS